MLITKFAYLTLQWASPSLEMYVAQLYSLTEVRELKYQMFHAQANDIIIKYIITYITNNILGVNTLLNIKKR